MLPDAEASATNPYQETKTVQDASKTSDDKNEVKNSQEFEEECEPSPSQDSPSESMNSEQMDVDDQESPMPPAIPPCPMTVPLPGIDDWEQQQNAPSSSATNSFSTSLEKGPCILIFDSLPGNQRWKVVQTLREYLTIEYEAKKKETRTFDRNTMRGINVTLLPRQENYTDCGIFLLQYVESFFEKPLTKFSSPLPSLQNWFPDSKIAGKRQELRELILSLQKNQQDNATTKDSNRT